MNYLGEIIHRYSPTFAALASLREIFRVSVAALPRWVSMVNTLNICDRGTINQWNTIR